MSSLQPKAVYEPVTKLEAFYTGGSVRVTRDQKHIVCACGDEVKIVDVATGTVAKTLPGDSEPITSLAVSPDCRSLVAASRSLSVKLWDWTSGECKRTWKPHRAPVADLAIDASGGYVASGSADRSVRVTDLAGGFTTHHFTGHGGIVLKVLFHPKQLLLFSSCDAGEVRGWDLVTKAPLFALEGGHMSAVPALALSPDGWLLMSGGRDRVVCCWDIRSGKRLATLPVYEALEGLAVLPQGSAFPGVAAAAAAAAAAAGQQLTPGGSKAAKKPLLFFATAGDRGVIRIWRSDTGACVYTHHGSSSSLLAAAGGSSKGGSKKAAAADDGAVAAAGSEFVELMLLPGGKGLLAATGDARLLFYHPKVLEAAAGSGSGGSELALTRQLVGNFDEVTDLSFLYASGSDSSSSSSSPAAAAGGGGGVVLHAGEPRRLAVATNSHDIRLFDLADGSCVGSCVGHRDIVLCLDTVRPAAGVELLASGAKDCEVRVWDPATSSCLAVAAGHVAAVTAVAWSASKTKAGKFLATGGSDKLLKLWDTSKLLAAATAAAAAAAGDDEAAPVQPALLSLSTVAAVAAHEKDINAIAFAPNDALLATASQDRSVKLWRLPSLVLAHTLRGHRRGVWDLAFSPVDQVLLTASADKLLKLWSVSDGSCLRTFEGHTGGVLRCSFLTSGTQVLSAGADGLLKLWDGKTGANTATFEGHDDRIWGLAASSAPDESLLASGGADSRIVLWRDATATKAAEAEAAEEQLALQQQELSNALADGDYATAARLAFQLRHPGRLLQVLRQQPGGPGAALAALQGLVGQLQEDELATALTYCREWNTNTRNAPLAQVLLKAVLSSHKPQRILQIPGARELLDGLLAYSQRHAARMDRLLRSTFLLDYTLAASQVLLPEDAATQQQQQEPAAAAGPFGFGSGAAGRGVAAGEGAGAGAGVLKMNGGLHSDDYVSSDDGEADAAAQGSDDDDDEEEEEQDDAADDAADEEEEELEQELEEVGEEEESDDEEEQQQGKASSRKQQQKQQQQEAADAGDEYIDDGVQLPGWGGGDDADDGWASEEQEEEQQEDSSGDEGAAAGWDSDAEMAGSSSSGEEEEEMPAVPAGKKGAAAAAAAAAARRQQQQSPASAGKKQQQQGSRKAAAAASGSSRKRKPPAAAIDADDDMAAAALKATARLGSRLAKARQQRRRIARA